MKSYDLTFAAEEDLRSIWDYTSGRWGLDHADTYLAQIETCCETIGDGSARENANDALPEDVRVLRCDHHYIF